MFARFSENFNVLSAPEMLVHPLSVCPKRAERWFYPSWGSAASSHVCKLHVCVLCRRVFQLFFFFFTPRQKCLLKTNTNVLTSEIKKSSSSGFVLLQRSCYIIKSSHLHFFNSFNQMRLNLQVYWKEDEVFTSREMYLYFSSSAGVFPLLLVLWGRWGRSHSRGSPPLPPSSVCIL